MSSFRGFFVPIIFILILFGTTNFVALKNNAFDWEKQNKLASCDSIKLDLLNKAAILCNQKEEITSQRDKIEKKNTILKEAYQTIERKTNEITGSINYH